MRRPTNRQDGRPQRGTAPRTGRARALAVLADVGGVGPYFVIETGGTTGGWRRIGHLYRNVDGQLDRLVTTYAERLQTGERRVAASILFQGFAARLWSPVLACVARGLPLPDVRALRLWWRYRPGEPLGLLVTEPDLDADAGAVRISADRAAESVKRLVVEEHLAPMVAALRDRSGVAGHLLWGNASSALVGTLLVLRSAGLPVGVALDVARRLLDEEPLRGTGALTVDGGVPAFRRRSCCLYYRVPGGGLCGDCSLHR